jgi:glutamate/tyrosine decarboxylase-like PLP-dependent enzyme
MSYIYHFFKAHSSIERAALLASVICKKIAADSKYSLRGEQLADQIVKDKKEGLIPFYVKTDSA